MDFLEDELHCAAEGGPVVGVLVRGRTIEGLDLPAVGLAEEARQLLGFPALDHLYSWRQGNTFERKGIVKTPVVEVGKNSSFSTLT